MALVRALPLDRPSAGIRYVCDAATTSSRMVDAASGRRHDCRFAHGDVEAHKKAALQLERKKVLLDLKGKDVNARFTASDELVKRAIP